MPTATPMPVTPPDRPTGSRTPAYLLRDLDPHEVALEAVRVLRTRIEGAVEGLQPAYEFRTVRGVSPTETRVYQIVHQLATYGKLAHPRPKEMVDALASELEAWFGEAYVTEAEPSHPLSLCVAAARAREQVADGLDLTSMQLAILLSTDRDYINGLALRGEIPEAYRSKENRHRPWRFRVTRRLRQLVDSED